MSVRPKPKPKPKPKPGTPFHLSPDDGKVREVYRLVLAAYFDDLAGAKYILKDEPQQINARDPHSGLTALHIAIFRGNAEMVKLLAQFPGRNMSIKDNFGRLAVDMLAYTKSQAIFDVVMQQMYPAEEQDWFRSEDGSGNVTRFPDP